MSGPALSRGRPAADPAPRPATGIRQPAVLVPLWWLLGALCLVEALHEVTGLGDPDSVLGLGLEAFLLVAATVICLGRAFYESRGRAPWIWIGALTMSLGGLLSLLDRRLRIGAPARHPAAVPAE